MTASLVSHEAGRLERGFVVVMVTGMISLEVVRLVGMLLRTRDSADGDSVTLSTLTTSSWGWATVSCVKCWCFLPDQKILFLAEVIEFQNLDNTGNNITRANFKRNFPKMNIFWNIKIYLLLHFIK